MKINGNKMADVLTNGNHNDDEVLDFPIMGADHKQSSHKPVVIRAFENELDFSSDMDIPLASPTPNYDDLLGNLHIYTLWMRKFAKNKNDADGEWLKFRKNALDQYDAFEKKLKKLERDLSVTDDTDEYLDMNSILQKKENIDAIYSQKDENDAEFAKVSKLFEQFSQYLSREENRKKVDTMIANLRERYFNALHQLNRKRETLRWIIPRLQRYKTSGSEVKQWLDSAETRSECFITNHNNVSSSQDVVEQIIDELNEKKNIYEDFLAAGKEIYGVDHQMQMDELQHDIEDVAQRWCLLVSNMERYLDRIEMEKKTAEIEKKSEVEKIDIKIQDETQMCACCTPFKITKVGDGKYTFGTSKTIRLLRIHGTSIVIRVGGGWEYLYNFLMKVDPCRAKQLAATPPNKNMDTKHLSGISLTPLDKEDMAFTMSIKTNVPRKSSSQQSRKPSRGSFVSTPSTDELDSCGESFESLTLSESSSTSSVPAESRPKSRSGSATPLSRTTKERTIYGRKFSHTDSKLYRSTDNLLRKKSDTPRVSLMDRQATYARKRHSLMHSTTELNI